MTAALQAMLTCASLPASSSEESLSLWNIEARCALGACAHEGGNGNKKCKARVSCRSLAFGKQEREQYCTAADINRSSHVLVRWHHSAKHSSSAALSRHVCRQSIVHIACRSRCSGSVCGCCRLAIGRHIVSAPLRWLCRCGSS